MDTNLSFKNFGGDPPGHSSGSGSGRPQGSIQRQSSIYNLTFDELHTVGGIGKDFGSMNMDELLKSIFCAEETQTMVPANGGQQGGVGSGWNGGYLQRQGSLTLPRTLSQKKVDDVWKDISKEYASVGDGCGMGGLNMTQRQQTLGEITLEEFLVKAGVVMEDTQLAKKPNNGGGYFSDLPNIGNNTNVGIGFQQMGRNTGLMGSRIADSSNHMSIQSSTLPLNVNGVRSNQQQLPQQQAQAQAQVQQQLFPKQPTLAYASQMNLPSSAQLGSPGIRGGILGLSDQTMNGGLVQNAALQGGGMGMVGLGAGAVTVATSSPANPVSSDGIGKSNGDTSSVSPAPYMFNGGIRGRKSSGAVEKVVERRQRRMIKNRESAARSRARKQAYTMELEAEVAKLKEENEELQKKMAEMIEMQKNQVIEMMNMQRGKKRCLRRTQTGPW